MLGARRNGWTEGAVGGNSAWDELQVGGAFVRIERGTHHRRGMEVGPVPLEPAKGLRTCRRLVRLDRPKFPNLEKAGSMAFETNKCGFFLLWIGRQHLHQMGHRAFPL